MNSPSLMYEYSLPMENSYLNINLWKIFQKGSNPLYSKVIWSRAGHVAGCWSQATTQFPAKGPLPASGNRTQLLLGLGEIPNAGNASFGIVLTGYKFIRLLSLILLLGVNSFGVFPLWKRKEKPTPSFIRIFSLYHPCWVVLNTSMCMGREENRFSA